jgi:hypothetical protein
VIAKRAASLLVGAAGVSPRSLLDYGREVVSRNVVPCRGCNDGVCVIVGASRTTLEHSAHRSEPPVSLTRTLVSRTMNSKARQATPDEEYRLEPQGRPASIGRRAPMRNVWWLAAITVLTLLPVGSASRRVEAQEGRFKTRELTAFPADPGLACAAAGADHDAEACVQSRVHLRHRLPHGPARGTRASARSFREDPGEAAAPLTVAAPPVTASVGHLLRQRGGFRLAGRTAARHHGGGGSCWAFATHGVLEGQWIGIPVDVSRHGSPRPLPAY